MLVASAAGMDAQVAQQLKSFLWGFLPDISAAIRSEKRLFTFPSILQHLEPN